MRKMFESEWQGIQFTEFSKVSSAKLAASEFYQAFYEEFFKRYKNWDQISPVWRESKKECADFIVEKCGRGKVLSVGCGLGFMEHYIKSCNAPIDLYINEVATTAWKWVDAEFDSEHKSVGCVPACLPKGLIFDMVYFSLVEYTFKDEALIECLSKLRCFILPSKGRLLIFGSLEECPNTFKEKIIFSMRKLKANFKAVLDILGLCDRGQFWGWVRTKEEFRNILKLAGYTQIEEGFLGEQYWILGSY